MFSLIDGEPVQLVYGFAEEVQARLQAIGGTRGPLPWLNTASLPYDLFSMKLVLDHLTAEKHLRVLYQARLIDVVLENRRITHVIVQGRGGTFAIKARAFVDCTGDGDLCAMARADYEYDPALLQFPTAMFRMGGVDTARSTQISRQELHRLLETAVSDGFDLPRTAGGVYSVREGVVHLNITKVAVDGHPPNPFDPDELAKAEREGRLQVQRYLEVFRKYVPGYANAFILDTGAELGIRESRRVSGDYTLTTCDVLAERKFDDAIAINCWPIEDHGEGRSTRWVWLRPGGYNHIPYRALIPRSLENVLVAGRCVSCSRDAQAAIRVTANCFSMGQAAGIAAAMASDGDVRSVNVAALQAALQTAGVNLNPIVC
jgi:hypothetical protein